MGEPIQAELEKLRTALAGLEAQRLILGDAIVEPALQSIREKINALEAQSGQQSGSDERRILTILFTDLVDSTRIAETLDPEDYRALVAAIHEAAGRAVLQHHGSVLQYLGDGLLAAFGLQEVSEQAPENAVRAGLDIQRGCAALQTHPPLKVRVGIHTGLVLVGELNLLARQEYTASGDAMNLAARLQSAAPPGGILISQDTYRYIRNLFDVTAQPPVHLKGKSEPVQTYLVYRARPTRFRNVTRGVAGIETHTIGREEELERLRSLCQEALGQNTAYWVQLLGSAGIGKSRLMAEVMRFLEPKMENLWLLKARALQGDERQAYKLIRRFWFNRFQIPDDIPLAEAEMRWVSSIQELASVGRPSPGTFEMYGEEAAHSLGFLIGLPFATSPYLVGRRQDPIQVRGRAYMISHFLFEALCAFNPVVILLEDLHWIDPASWDYLVEVLLNREQTSDLSKGKKHGVFILATARPEWKPPKALLSHSQYRPIHLKPLSRKDSQVFVDHLLNQVIDVPEYVPRLLIERSEGVPFFIEELFNWLLDQGIIDRQFQPWRFVPERWQQAPLPSTLQHLLLARLGSIPQPEQKVLKRGAIFGRDFWENGVESMGVADSHNLLTQAQERGFVDFQPSSTFAGEQEWSFYHNLLQQTAYESLLKRERKSLHQIAGIWLESQARQANRLDEFAGLLAEHYDLAGLGEQASHWYLLAGQHAKDRFALQEARRLIDRALELMPLDDPDERWQALLVRSGVLSMLGEFETNQTDLDSLLSLAHTTGNEQWLAEAYHRQGYNMANTGDYRGAIQAYEHARLSAQHSGDKATEALVLSLIVASLDRLGEMSAAPQAADQATGLVHSFDDEIIQAMVLTNLSAYYGSSGDHVRAIEMLEQQIEITQRLSNLYGESIGLLNLGYEYMILGQYDMCIERMEQSIQRSESIGARRQSAFTRLNLALAYWRLQRNQDAKQTLDRVIPELLSTGDAYGTAVGHTYLGLVLEQDGSIETAKQQYSEASQILHGLGTMGNLSDAVAGLARCALALGYLPEARQCSQETWEYLEQNSGKGMELPQLAYLTCFRVFDHLGEVEKARLALEQGLQDLNENAARINKPDWKKSFLENIPEHRELREAWKQISSKGFS